tara:strand:+ start:393 stop:581 length:189 start_codon:yes stop_codon:yes gene_type:complete
MITKKEIMVLGSGISGIGSVMLAKKMDIDVFLSEGNIIDEDTKKIFEMNILILKKMDMIRKS